ncbi:helix-turn-helix domain-containing protein [Cecembia rubra]|uniref:Helix-turn-helix protein n=1 Tax=Cecembia rubra TaxID=1485585 RepID=A0A2P8DXL9_9BACT|nr:helix-turn-helix domain-containing protein [Cecembia rubra]PSL01917.1 helix-turn-helix protein [Cecembia rubra]
MDNLILSTYSPEELTGIINTAVKEAVKSIQTAPQEKTGEKLLSRKETAEKLKISLVTLNDWTKRGMLTSYIIGGRVLYKESEIEKSLNQVKTVKF